MLTESLAILHYVDDLVPQAGLIPPCGDPARAEFSRWAVFLVAAVYPTFTYGDDTSKWVPNKEGAKELRESTTRGQRAEAIRDRRKAAATAGVADVMKRNFK